MNESCLDCKYYKRDFSANYCDYYKAYMFNLVPCENFKEVSTKEGGR
ncbi:MAG: hypothetical protein QXM27_02910 [Candidatus Pacearchaeota archaeon]